MGVWDGHVHTTVFRMDNQQGPIVQLRELCSVLRSSMNGMGVWGRMDTCICMTQYPCCPPEIHNIVNWLSVISVAQSCPTPCDNMDSSTPGLLVHHQLPELAQTRVQRVGDAIQPSHHLSSPFPPAFNISQHQGLYEEVSFSHQVPKVLELQLQHQFFQ